MAAKARHGQAEHEVLRQCRRGLDVGELQGAVLRSLRAAIPVDAAFFATADPETLLFTGAHTEDPLGDVAALLMDNEFGGRDVNTFTSLAHAGAHVASLDEATRRERITSPRYRDILRPIGLGDELRAALVVGAECWGYVCLHREDGRLGFSEAEAALVARIGPHVAHGLRQAVLLHRRPAAEHHRPGVLVLDDEMNLVASTPDADELLSLIGPGSAHRPLPIGVYTVAAALTRAERAGGTPPAPPSVRCRARTGGWVDVHASRLVGAPNQGRIAVVVEQAEPRSAVGVVLAAYRLTPREREVARLVLRGTSTHAISQTLHISTHTVQDHLKSVFDKVGVRSRRDLVGLLLGSA